MLLLVKILFAICSLFSTYSRGAEFYDFQSQQCCYGAVPNLPPGASYNDYDCCGADIYEIQWEYDSAGLTSLCCLNKHHTGVNSSALCCGTEVYQEESQACQECSGGFQVVDLPRDKKKAGKTEVCGKSSAEKEFYDPNEKICCSGMLYKWEVGRYCCGDKYINYAVSKCCIDYVEDVATKQYQEVYTVAHYNGDIPYMAKCCEEVVVDASKQECCGGVVVDFPTNYSSDYYDYYSEDYINVYTWGYPAQVCCGTKLITDKETQFCVNNERIMTRDNRNQIYCGEQWHTISGDEPLNVYCNNDKAEQLKGTELKCSVKGGKVTYDVTKQVCVDNQIVDLPKNEKEIGRKTLCSKSMDTYSNIVWPDLHYVPPFDYTE